MRTKTMQNTEHAGKGKVSKPSRKMTKRLLGTLSSSSSTATSSSTASPTISTTRPSSASSSASSSSQPFLNRQRTLILAKSGISALHRHLMVDLASLLPHGKREGKYDTRTSRDYTQINELCEMKRCANCLFFETYNHGRELYLYAAKSPLGPTVKFRVSSIATMKELRMAGNCLKGSRPVLHFDAAFESQPSTRLIKELLTQVFATPHGHPKSKPFVDHVFGFFMLDGKIWFRNYQIVDRTPANEKMSLVEIGPRFVLDPVRVLEGCFEGDVLYNNDQFVSVRTRVRHSAEEHRASAMETRRKRRQYLDVHSRTEVDPVKMVWYEKEEEEEEEYDEDEEEEEQTSDDGREE